MNLHPYLYELQRALYPDITAGESIAQANQRCLDILERLAKAAVAEHISQRTPFGCACWVKDERYSDSWVHFSHPNRDVQIGQVFRFDPAWRRCPFCVEVTK